MFPEDRVLVGVIKRKRDLAYARDDHWYRIPQVQMPKGVYAEYLAFFFSGGVFKEQSGGIHYFTERKGLELVYRKDLLPKEANHPRAGDAYYKVQLGELIEKNPPVLNPSRRTITFIHTTWDRFVHAAEISDLYSKADYFVDRIYHALRNTGLKPERTWEAEYRDLSQGAQLRVLCEKGTVTASTQPADDSIYLNDAEHEDRILAEIKAAIARKGGPALINIPLERF
jgi:hypothetical protein